MAEGLCALTEKEKQTLRLLLAGHDAKSMARHLGLSVHTINERLRDARRKLAVSTSKEAARILRRAEGGIPESLGDEQIGDAAAAPAGQQVGEPGARSIAKPRNAWAIGGLAMMTFSLGLLALLGSSGTMQNPVQPREAAAIPSPAAESAAAQAARQWLELVDAGDWSASLAATTASFRSTNSIEAWEAASVEARVPLGRTLSRRLVSEEGIPAPPNGYQLVRFRTRFENGGEATETLSLAREEAAWKVAGYYIEQ
jgi:DNA-binding CsgD family transcriptional regulator